MRTLLTISLVALACATSLLACDDGGTDTIEATEWSATYPAIEDRAWLLSTHSPGDGTFWAVGGSPDAGLVLQRDREGTWSEVDTQLDVPLLNWVYALAPDDVWTVGNGGTVLHWDGSAWTQESTPTDQDLWGVWGVSSDDLWAVGGIGREAGQATILRRQAGTWTAVGPDSLERPNVNAYFKVWGTSADNVYIVGQRGIVLRWDGSRFIELGVGTSEDLISLWGTGPDRIAMVGGRNNGVIVTWDGTEWRTQSLAPLPGINGVWMRSPERIHIAGKRGTAAVLNWDLAAIEADLDTQNDLHAIYADPATGEAVTVGGNLDFIVGPYQGLLFERRLGAEE